ncbi:MAG: thiamine phosphate synthase [Bacteroidales bacterium]|nr:thiamine phosphate synthase [Bacteroidales bacterium]
MKIIYITLPEFFAEEALLINKFFTDGLEVLHLRKPKAEESDYEKLINEIEPKYYNRIVLHDYFSLALKYGLRGVHLNSRNPLRPEHFSGTVSKSLHSVQEVINEKQNFDYVSLSPIFDSISKEGYNSKFSLDELKILQKQGVIDEKVYALGGVTFDKIELLKSLGFGGAMILGAAWRK